MNVSAKRGPTAFTLIELLVVIGIIGVLIAILLPVLSGARRSATKAHCLSNLHQIAVYLQEYQNQYRGQLPIYFTPAYVGKIIYHGGVNNYTNLGLLVSANIAPQSGSELGRVFYCPGSSVWGTQRQFNYVIPGDPAASNPWVGWPGYSTRITYSQRPEYWVWSETGSNWNIHYPNVRFDMDGQTEAQDVFVPPYGAANTQPIFPRVSTLSRGSATAIITDLIDADSANRRLIHRGGWNVLYANWSAKFVPQECFATQLSNLESQEAKGASPATRRAWFDLWQELDRY
jgi:prepilin-type N-terminal cleavage/methylation domain-containing protein